MNRKIPRALFTPGILFGILFGIPLGLLSCTDVPPLPEEVESFRITFVGDNDRGTPESPRPFAVAKSSPDRFVITIEALRAGEPDLTFDGWVMLDVRPEKVSCGRISPTAVKLSGGLARDVEVRLTNAYCTVRIVATDEGFVPAAGTGPSQCENGKDDDGDGYVDWGRPVSAGPTNRLRYGDQGCARPNDDTEEGGTGAAGVSDPIYYRCPTMADVQTPVLGESGDGSPLEGCRVTVDRGWLLVTRLGVDGLYVTDFEGVKWDPAQQNWSFAPEELSYDSMFVYNYSTPLNLQEGDCLTQLDGTVEEFYGFTEMSKPVWKKGDFAFCAAKARAAGLEDCPSRQEDRDTPKGALCRQRVEQLANSPVDVTKLLIADAQGTKTSVWGDPSELLAERFESGLVKLSDVKMFTEAKSCDKDADGVIDFSLDEERNCSNNCGDGKQCIVKETYSRYNQWSVHFTDGAGAEREVSVVTAGAIPRFNPLAAADPAQARPLGAFVGTLRHLFFGRPPWIIEARRPSDCPDCTN